MPGQAVFLSADPEVQAGGVAPAAQEVEEDERARVAEVPTVGPPQDALRQPDEPVYVSGAEDAAVAARPPLQQADQPGQRDAAPQRRHDGQHPDDAGKPDEVAGAEGGTSHATRVMSRIET